MSQANGKDWLDDALDIMATAWGRQDGYAFFPWIRGDAQNKRERILSFREGKAWHWPEDKEPLLEWLRENLDHDVYWCPSLFEYPRRLGHLAMDERCLWADLDEVDPLTLETEWPPSVAWETSPGRYQALWLVGPGADMQGASWPGNENQRLTKAIGADPSGWDTTQLLRIPGWINHKPEYRDAQGNPPPAGSLTWPRWRSRRRWYLDDFEDLPQIPRAEGLDSVLEGAVDAIDPRKLWTETRLKLKPTTRQLYTSRHAEGDRSEKLWILERELADAGLNATQIVALVRGTVWNKYEGRSDEFRRLAIEADKAVGIKQEQDDEKRKVKARRGEIADELEVMDEEGQRPKRQRIGPFLKHIKRPRWLVDQIWTDGSCGFIAGEPKQHKSWVALDLALSVSTGSPFLDHFRVERPGPTLYIQEEDPGTELKRRYARMWESKRADRLVLDDEGDLAWLPAHEMAEPELDVLVQSGLVLSDPDWQSWLDEELEDGKFRLLILDPMMMMLGDVDENKATTMTEAIFKPLKQLSTKHDVAICVVHHMRKSSSHTKDERGGQRMLGSVANHAWSQDSLYLTRNSVGLSVERESKSAAHLRFTVKGLSSKAWSPRVENVTGLWDESEGKVQTTREKKPTIRTVLSGSMEYLGPNEIAGLTGKDHMTVRRYLNTYVDNGQAIRKGNLFKWNHAPS